MPHDLRGCTDLASLTCNLGRLQAQRAPDSDLFTAFSLGAMVALVRSGRYVYVYVLPCSLLIAGKHRAAYTSGILVAAFRGFMSDRNQALLCAPSWSGIIC